MTGGIMTKKFRAILYEVCNYLELIMAVVVVVGIIISVFGLEHEIVAFWNTRGEAGSLYIFLDTIFEIVISIEFLKMLCQPSSDTILEVLIFLVARHMIIGDTNAFEDFISIVSIALLFGIKKYIETPREGKRKRSIFSSREEIAREDAENETDKQ